MKNIILAFGFVLLASGLKAQTASKNYVRTRTPRTKISSNTLLNTYTPNKDSVMTTIQYIDGLGRPLQTVGVSATPGGNDMVQPFAYDAYGREVKKYLPYATLSPASGAYQSTALSGSTGGYANSDQFKFYQRSSQTYDTIPSPYAPVAFEPSPLNRMVEQGAPGNAWQLTGSIVSNGTPGHTIKTVYLNNNATTWANDSITSRQVARYNATVNADQTRTLTANGYFPASRLTVTISKDENWTGSRAGTVEEYKDKEGRVVLKRQYNYTNTLQKLSTYYVYDDMGELAFVLPPLTGADSAISISQAKLNGLCYQYRYDERGRLSQKKIPGKGWEYTVYNTIDQPAATQDSLQRAANNWIFTKYDVQDRPIQTGIWNNGPVSRASLQTTLSGITTNLWETTTSTGNGYTNLAWPTSLVTATLTLNYYDNYSVPGLPPTYLVTTGVSKLTRGLPTAKKTAVLNTPTDMLWDVMYYDDLGRNIKSYTQHYFGGTVDTANHDLISTTYNFTNAPTTITRMHWNKLNHPYPLLTIVNTLIYDHMGRRLRNWEQITNLNSAPTTKTLLAKLAYNEIGQVVFKRLHSLDSTVFLQAIGYNYNERGWLEQTSAPLFEMQLRYNTGSYKQYNGNIAYQQWGTGGAPNTNTYTYTYDKLNRLTGGSSLDNYKERGITYDPMGNITALNRYQNGTIIDSLTYGYIGGTNTLQKVTDISGSNTGIVNAATTYTYDGNGNMLTNANITNTGQNKTFTYNLLNLPKTVVTSSFGTSTYTYDATGEKLRKVNVNAGVTTTTEYISGIQYKGTALDFIQTEEGKVTISGTTADYSYYLSDNLGNTRVTFDTQGGIVNTIQKDDYYPFGMEILRGTSVSPRNDYLYNKKELQEELGQYDYEHRFYNPVIGRFTSFDPMAEVSRRWSTYAYSYNNPLRFIDKDGMIPGDFLDENGKKVGSDGKDDGKVYVIKTTQKSFDSGAPSAGISKDDKKATEKFIKDNNGNTSAFEANDVAYKNSVEIEGKASTRQAMVDVVNQDNGKGGTADANNREYGGVVKTDGTVSQSPAGPVSDPTVNPNAHIDISSFDFQSTFHSHPSGTKTVSSTGNSPFSGTTLGGTTTSGSFLHAPSNVGGDVGNSGSKVNYVFSRGNGTAYIYNNTGVIATIPQANFVTPKQ